MLVHWGKWCSGLMFHLAHSPVYSPLSAEPHVIFFLKNLTSPKYPKKLGMELYIYIKCMCAQAGRALLTMLNHLHYCVYKIGYRHSSVRPPILRILLKGHGNETDFLGVLQTPRLTMATLRLGESGSRHGESGSCYSNFLNFIMDFPNG